MCKEWAAVQDSDSRIWEAVSVNCERAIALERHRGGTAGCLHRWLSARARGLRQLSFCDSCSCFKDTGKKVSDATPAPALPEIAAPAMAMVTSSSSMWES